METGKCLDAAMIREQLRQFVIQTGIRPNEFWVGSGAALVLHGLREHTQDIDIGTGDERTFLKLCSKLELVPTYKQMEDRYLGGTFAISHPGLDIDIRVEYYTVRSELTLSGGVFIYTPEMLLKQKLAFNRPKDQQDILKLQQYLAR